MKKSIIAIVLAVATLVTFIIPASAWSWKEEGEWQVATYWIPIAKDGEIKVDAELEAKYLEGDKVESYPDETPYRRSGYEAVWDAADANFFSYCAVDTTGLYIYFEIKDTTIFETLDADANTGDMMQFYLDWTTPDIMHPSHDQMNNLYKLDGTGFDMASYRTMYGVSGLQYLGWFSFDYKNVIASAWGFGPHTALGPEATDSITVASKLIEGGWAGECHVPWRDEEQKQQIADGLQFHCGLGWQSADDTDIDSLVDEKEMSVGITFDQRREIGLSYYAWYPSVGDLRWSETWAEGYETGSTGDTSETVDTADTVIAVVAALAVAGTGVVLFAKKREN